VANITTAPTMNFSLITFLSLSFIYNARRTLIYNIVANGVLGSMVPVLSVSQAISDILSLYQELFLHAGLRSAHPTHWLCHWSLVTSKEKLPRNHRKMSSQLQAAERHHFPWSNKDWI